MSKVTVSELDSISVKELDNNRFEITMGNAEYDILQKHADEAKITLENYIISVIEDYIEVLGQNLD